MRTIFLFRHGPVDYLNGISCCLGSRTDAPLAPEGRSDAAKLAPLLREAGISSVWSSPMLRCRQTAEAMSAGLPVGLAPGLEELDCGQWDGLSFDEIRARFPELYARRGLDPALPPPGGEAPSEAARRGLAALRSLTARTEGSIAVVAHAGINRAVLCALMGRPMADMFSFPQPYLCVNLLSYDDERFTVDAVGCSFREAVSIKEETEHEKTV